MELPAALVERYEAEEQLRLVEMVGEGGYGRVYRAHHLRLDTPVAVKVMNDRVQAMPSVVKLFAREARVMARIDHPNVLRVFDFADGPEGPYIVTEWMSGGALDRATDEPRLRAIGSAAASALQALHEAAILHRDVKPQNLMARADGRIKLGDLGVALAPDDAADRSQFVGTLPYMAPELFERTPAYGPSTDIYALGISLYQLWSGKLPYRALEITELVELIRDSTPPALPALRPGLTPSFTRLIGAMMDRSPAGRPTASEVVRVLASLPTEMADTVRIGPAPTATAIGTPPALDAIGTPSAPGAFVRVGPWVCTEEILRGQAWHLLYAHHHESGRQARMARLQKEWLLPVDVLLDAAQRSARWSHPAIVSVLDWGTWGERPYFVCGMVGMRFLELVQTRGAIGEVEALRLVEQIADAVAYVHERGYVFQMVDPNAIGSRPSGTGWMLDWPAFSAKIGSKSPRDRRYISPFTAPEVEAASTFAPASDLYALGATLSFALTGSQSWLGRVEGGTLPNHMALVVTAATRALLGALVARDPKQRPTAIEARDWARAIVQRIQPLD